MEGGGALRSTIIASINPGALHPLSPEMLYAGCQPVRRNRILAGFRSKEPALGSVHEKHARRAGVS